MSHSATTTRIGLALLFFNAALVGLVALLRHTSAQETAPPQANPVAESQIATDAVQPLSDAKESDAQNPSNDPILQEFRKLIQDPESGLDVAPITVPPLSPTAETSAFDPQSRRDGSSEGANDNRSANLAFRRLHLQMRRLESIQHLAAAALALTEEAKESLEAGQAEEAEGLLQRINELRSTIAELAAANGT